MEKGMTSLIISNPMKKIFIPMPKLILTNLALFMALDFRVKLESCSQLS